jgi:hypothetical protein
VAAWILSPALSIRGDYALDKQLIARDPRLKPAAVAKTWKRLENWLKSNLSVALDSLSSGLPERAIAWFEDAIGWELPAADGPGTCIRSSLPEE